MTYDANAEAERLVRANEMESRKGMFDRTKKYPKELNSLALLSAYQAGKNDGIEEIQMLRNADWTEADLVKVQPKETE